MRPGQDRTFTYDRADQPASVSGAAGGSFRYDGNLKRVKQIVDGETTYSVYGQSGALLFRRNVTTGVITDYIRVAGETVARTKNGVVSYLHQDHLGSPVAATDLAGAIEWREDYTPFGEERQDPAANDNDENFTGHIRDEATGLLYMQARYMDPVTTRFYSGDPVGFSPGSPQMFNRYSYTGNDPVNATDPTGMCMAENCPWGITKAQMSAEAAYKNRPMRPNVAFAGMQYSRPIVNVPGSNAAESLMRAQYVQVTGGLFLETSAEGIKAGIFESFEGGLGNERGPGAVMGSIDGDLETFKGSFATVGGQGAYGFLGGGVIFGDENSDNTVRSPEEGAIGFQVTVASPGGGVTSGVTTTQTLVDTTDNTAQQAVSGEIIYGRNCTYGCN